MLRDQTHQVAEGVRDSTQFVIHSYEPELPLRVILHMATQKLINNIEMRAEVVQIAEDTFTHNLIIFKDFTQA